MTRKFYIITTLIEGTPTAIGAKAVTSPSADSGATGSQIDDIRNSGVQVFAHSTGIWLRRASARSAAAYLTNATRFAYSVKEVGEFKRTVRPVKGYKFERPEQGGGFTLWYLEYSRGAASKAASDAQVDGLIPTRALARAAFAEQQAAHEQYGNPGKLRIVTVYADA